MPEFEDKTRGGYEYVILERDGPDGRMFGRHKYAACDWRGIDWSKDGSWLKMQQSDFDLIPRITVSEAVMAAARHELDTGASLRRVLAAALSIAHQEWEAGR